MYVELEYNPYAIKTGVIFNNNPNDKRGLQFSPIVNFPLQSWLKKRLDWPGLADKLRTISRGAVIDFIFIGRKIDYDDLSIELKGKIENLTLEHVLKYEVSEKTDNPINGEFSKVFASCPEITERKTSFRAIKSIIDEIITEQEANSESSEIFISSDEDFNERKQIIFGTYYPLFISSEVWRKHVSEIEKAISENFSRPYDSIFILLKNQEDKNLFFHQIENGIHVDEYNTAIADSIRLKYPGRSVLKDTEKLQSVLKKLFAILENEYEFVRDELSTMRFEALHQAYTDEALSERYSEFLNWKNWYIKHVSYFKKIMEEKIS